MSKLGVIHYNFPAGFSLDDFLRYARDTGYKYVELSLADIWPGGSESPEKEAEKVLKMLQDYGLQASAVGMVGNDFVVLDEDAVQAQVKRMEKIASVVPLVGCSIIRTEGGSPKDSVPEERWAEAIAGCLARCVDAAEKHDIYYAVDNHGLATNDADRQVEIFERVGSKRVGANVDTMNYRWFGHSLEKIDHFYEIIAPYALHTHLKDGFGSRGEYRGEALGEGEIHLKYAIECIKNAGYDGVWCSEYEGREGGEIGYRKCYEYMAANL